MQTENMTYSSEGCFQEVTHRCCRTLRLRVAVFNTGELEQTLASGGGDETSTSRGRDETAHDGTDLPADLRGHCVRLTKVGTPVTPTDGNDGKLGEDDGTTDGSRDFLCAFDTETDMAIEVTNGDECLETRTLTGTGLLLDRHDLHDFILELGQEEVDDLVFLNGEREEVDLLHGLDLAVLHETAELGDRNPVAPLGGCAMRA